MFTIVKIRNTEPVKMYEEDDQKQPIAGAFFDHELRKVKHSDAYLLKKVVEKRGNYL